MTATDRAVELVTLAAGAAADKLATDIIAYDVSEQLVITDAFLLCSASNEDVYKRQPRCRPRPAASPSRRTARPSGGPAGAGW